MYIYRERDRDRDREGVFHPKSAEYMFFSSAHGTFSRIDHLLGHKTCLSKFKKTAIISSIFFRPQHYETRNQPQEKKETLQNHEQVEAKQYATKQKWITEETKEEFQKYLETNEKKNTMIRNLCDAGKMF